MNLKEIFSNKLKMYRKQRNLTQEQLAELVNVAPRHISFLETARSFPSSELIERLCNTLNINYSDLFEIEQNLSKDEILSNLGKITKTLDRDKLNFLLKMAKELC